MTCTVTYVANTNQLKLNGLQDSSTQAYINDAVVAVTVRDATDTEVAGQVWPLAMDYVAASNGNYTLTLTKDLAFVHKGRYTASINAVATVGPTERVGHWDFPFIAETRKE